MKTSLPRVQKYQLKHKLKGLCRSCPEKAVGNSTSCLKHLIEKREKTRSYYGHKIRHLGRESYYLEELVAEGKGTDPEYDLGGK